MRISIIGTGTMGSAVAVGLLEAGHQLTVYNRTRAKAERLASRGATVVGSAGEAVASSEYTIVVLFDEKSTREVLLAADTRAALAGRALISAAAMSPEECVALQRDIGRAGGRLSEVTILTYPEPVQQRDSEFILACVSEDAAGWAGVFGNLGSKVYDVGAVGNASRAQMSLWLSYMFLTIAMAYSLAAFEKLQMPVKVVQDILANNSTLALAGANDIIPEMSARAYGKERWSVDNMILSIDQVVAFARGLQLDTRVLEAVREMYAKAAAKGYGAHDITALYEALNPRA